MLVLHSTTLLVKVKHEIGRLSRNDLPEERKDVKTASSHIMKKQSCVLYNVDKINNKKNVRQPTSLSIKCTYLHVTYILFNQS